EGVLGAGELLDVVVVGIRDVDVPAAVRCHAVGRGELSVARAEAAPRGEEGAAGVELLDAVVIIVRDVDVPARGRHAAGRVELSVARAEAAPRGEEGAARAELLDAVVIIVRDVDVPARVGRHAGGAVELSVARAVTPPRGEEAAGWPRRGCAARWGGFCALGGDVRARRGGGRHGGVGSGLCGECALSPAGR